MDEREWLTCTDPVVLMDAVIKKGTSDRKCILFAVACCYLALKPEPKQTVIWHGAERFADGELEVADLRESWETAPGVGWFEKPRHWAALAAVHNRAPDVPNLSETTLTVLRCIFGNPFHPVALDPALRTPAILALAQAAYDNRTLPAGTLEPDRLAVLTDALEESGCADADILGHLRGPGVHVRGCWVVDLLLNKS